MKKKISLLVIAAALSTAFCFCACNGDDTAAAVATQIEKASAAVDNTDADKSVAASTDDRSPDIPISAPPDDFPKPGDIIRDKKVGSVEKIPNCDDDKHGIVYVYDEQGELICTIKY